MSRHQVDTSTEFSADAYENLPPSRQIEDPELDPVPSEVGERDTKFVLREPYQPDYKLAEAVNLAIALGRPLLLQGDPGCGKTRLAYAVAYALGLPLEECYIKSTSRAQDLLYTYDAVNRLYDAQLGSEHSEEISNYIRLGPLGRAIVRATYGRRSAVLIDEIDKADIDFPNDLLWELDRLTFRVAEAPYIQYAIDDRPELRPIVFVTNNEEKPLPDAFLRRCIFHHIDFPEDQSFLESVLSVHQLEDKPLGQKAINILLQLRQLDLSKKPGLSELLDWVGYLTAVQTPIEELDALPYIGALLKKQIDQERAKEEFKK